MKTFYLHFRTKCMNPSNYSLWRFHLYDLNITSDYHLRSVRVIQEIPFKEEKCPTNCELHKYILPFIFKFFFCHVRNKNIITHTPQKQSYLPRDLSSKYQQYLRSAKSTVWLCLNGIQKDKESFNTLRLLVRQDQLKLCVTKILTIMSIWSLAYSFYSKIFKFDKETKAFLWSFFSLLISIFNLSISTLFYHEAF